MQHGVQDDDVGDATPRVRRPGPTSVGPATSATVPASPDPEPLVRLFRRRRRQMPAELTRVEDGHPKDGLFSPPLVVTALTVADPEPHADGVRVTFRATIKDADGRRCPDVAVDATIRGPERTASGSATTDMMGAVRFRMAGPRGAYEVTIDDVAAGGMAWDRDASRTTAHVQA